MTVSVVIIGSGGFGREALEVVQAAYHAGGGHLPVGVIDDDPTAPGLVQFEKAGVPYLGGRGVLLRERLADEFLIAVGDTHSRETIARQLNALDMRAAIAVHPSAGIGSRTTIGAGSIVCAGAQISCDVVIGEHVHINPNVTIGHDAELRSFTSVNPGAVLSGNVNVRERSLIGAGAVVLQNLSIGQDAIVGASACVTRNVGDGQTVVGIPARVLIRE